MERWQNKVAVVTGASSGIGAAVVRALIENGMIVVGLARRTDRVEDLRKTLPADRQKYLHAYKCDVSDLESVNNAFDWIEREVGGTDVLVNNAGAFNPGQVLTQELSGIQEVFQTNVMGVIYCTRRAFHSMKERNVAGHVVFVNSIVGHNVFSVPTVPLPTFSAYPSSKYAITALNEVVRQELRGFGTKIKTTSISPGLVDTPLVSDALKAQPILQPEDIAAGIVYAVNTPPHVQVHELTIKAVGAIF